MLLSWLNLDAPWSRTATPAHPARLIGKEVYEQKTSEPTRKFATHRHARAGAQRESGGLIKLPERSHCHFWLNQRFKEELKQSPACTKLPLPRRRDQFTPIAVVATSVCLSPAKKSKVELA